MMGILRILGGLERARMRRPVCTRALATQKTYRQPFCMLDSLKSKDSQDSGGAEGGSLVSWTGVLLGTGAGLASLARFLKVALKSLVSSWEGQIELFSHAAAGEVGG